MKITRYTVYGILKAWTTINEPIICFTLEKKSAWLHSMTEVKNKKKSRLKQAHNNRGNPFLHN